MRSIGAATPAGRGIRYNTGRIPMLAETRTRALSRLGLDRRGTDLLPRQPVPMLLSKADSLISSDAWTYEPKWDGFRVLAAVREGSVRLLSRNGHPFTKVFRPMSPPHPRGFPGFLHRFSQHRLIQRS